MSGIDLLKITLEFWFGVMLTVIVVLAILFALLPKGD